MSPIDYLAVGHVTRDLTPDGPRLGGTVTFSALTARAMGLRVGIVTSLPDDFTSLLAPLDDILIVRIPAEAATTFANVYTASGRRQTLSGRAASLSYGAIPEAWRSAPILHLSPVAGEVEPELARHFPAACVCATPQGWMRQWDARGRVSYQPLQAPEYTLLSLRAVVLSVEDVHGDLDAIERLVGKVPTVAVTQGAEGCTLYLDGQPQVIAAPDVQEVDSTGAGDIFAAAFFARLCAADNPLRAARFATLVASASVTRPGLSGVPDAGAIRKVEKQLGR